jgi:hypothetical protein
MLFNFYAVIVGSGTFGVLLLVAINESVYVYDNTPFIYLETVIAGIFVVWALKRTFKR